MSFASSVNFPSINKERPTISKSGLEFGVLAQKTVTKSNNFLQKFIGDNSKSDLQEGVIRPLRPLMSMYVIQMKLTQINYSVCFISIRTAESTMSGETFEQSSSENAKTMRGWEIYEYGGIDALTFSQNIVLPVIKSPTDVLVEVIATAVNPFDQLQTGVYAFFFNNPLEIIRNK